MSLRRTLPGLLDRLLNAAVLSQLDRTELGYRAKREIETNRYPLAIHLEPLKSAFAKLCPSDDPPKPPPTTGRRGGHRKMSEPDTSNETPGTSEDEQIIVQRSSRHDRK